MGPRVLALAVGRVAEQRRRRSRPGKWPLVADIDPQPPGLRLAGARRQNRHRRIVNVQGLRSHDLGGEHVDQRLQRRRRRADPAGQGRGFQADALAGEDLGLAIERQMVVVLRDQDVRQQPRAGATAGDRVIRRRRRHHRVASPAGELLADVPDHLEAAGDVIQGLGRVLANPPQRTAAARAGWAGAMHRLLARQVLGQRPAGGLLRLGHAFDDGGRLGRGTRQPLGLVGFQGLDRQLECSVSRASFSEDRPNSARR